MPIRSTTTACLARRVVTRLLETSFPESPARCYLVSVAYSQHHCCMFGQARQDLVHFTLFCLRVQISVINSLPHTYLPYMAMLTKAPLFRSYCTSVYTCQLWRNHEAESLNDVFGVLLMNLRIVVLVTCLCQVGYPPVKCRKRGKSIQFHGITDQIV